MSVEPKNFTPQQKRLLERYVTNTSKSIFALKNLPEVVKGALFSKYSRSHLGLRNLLLNEFLSCEEVIPQEKLCQEISIERASDFYSRILDNFGDDSIGELGGSHLAMEDISMIAAKYIEDCRIGGSPLEKSTRFISFDQKKRGKYLFFREPRIMSSQLASEYEASCNCLFDTYKYLIPLLSNYLKNKYVTEKEPLSENFTITIKRRVLDCLRGLLPASTLTNLGLFGNGRFFEGLLQKLQCHNLRELQEIGRLSFCELSKVISSFIRRAEKNHKHFITYQDFQQKLKNNLQEYSPLHIAHEETPKINTEETPAQVTMIDFDAQAFYKVAAALVFPYSNKSLAVLQKKMQNFSLEELRSLFKTTGNCRTNRRHKSPRALEHTFFTFEIIADFGVYRDLQRHRMLTQERQQLSCQLGYFLPQEIVDAQADKLYKNAMEVARKSYEKIVGVFPEEAQYAVPMGYNIRWYICINLRSAQWLTELRSVRHGHPSYRFIAQTIAKDIEKACPLYHEFLRFVDCEKYSLSQLLQKEEILQEKSSLC